MAGNDETVILEAVQRMALEEGSGDVELLKGEEFGRNVVFVCDFTIPSGDPLEVEMKVAAVLDKVGKLIIDKVKDSPEGSKFRIVVLHIGMDEIQAEKMDKVPVQAVEVQAEKMDKSTLDCETEPGAETGDGLLRCF